MHHYRISGAIDHRGLVADHILPVLQRKTRCTIPEASIEDKTGTVLQSRRRVSRWTVSTNRSVSKQLLNLNDSLFNYKPHEVYKIVIMNIK